ncbi:MscS Mechanosensitive ion channel [Methanosalsum zhilinae DSM 4017]|uniref:MscS Mechanosensitive ion channel n=1 Tax=Methanosalsum zhilinae (strain DSM 4017 / NBRC 107636 / OCM 62 / WeN5) TaxID=679901 RepID=F7XNH8_METZD|nr:mechanosensitive ion channel family protein [Methanosalsum zhilinae]AEH61236.1 MscS Mechanosensitive ion channel [Methanosalsum zhilinae DSM 4017]
MISSIMSHLPESGLLIIKFFTSIFALILIIIASKAITIYLRRLLKERVEKGSLDVLLKFTYYTLIGIAFFLFVLPTLGVLPSSLLVAGGIFGFVIGFASQSIVGNLISGIFLIIERPIEIGNQVNIEQNSGIVTDINLISTIIRTYDGLYIRIPNEKVFTNTITNFVANVARRFEYVVGIRYSDDADRAIKIINDVVEENPFVLKNPKPMAFVDNLGDNSVNIFVRMWAPATDWFDAKTTLLWKIKVALQNDGIEIAFPQRTLWFQNELRTGAIKKMGNNEGFNDTENLFDQEKI